MSTLADRVWYAIHCLRRNADGSVPKYVSIERKVGLPNAFLSKMVRGKRPEPSAASMVALASVLDVDLQWLVSGIGNAPSLSGPLPPRPGYEMIAAWEPGADAPPPGTEAVAAWRPGSSSDAQLPLANRKTRYATRASPVASKSDDRPDSCPSRSIVVAMARAQEDADAGSRGVTEGAIAALLAERREDGDPGLQYWYDQMKKYLEMSRGLHSTIKATDK